MLPPETHAQPGASATHLSVSNRDQSNSTPQQTNGNTTSLGSQSQPQGSGLTSTARGPAGQNNVAPSHTPVDPLQAQQGQFHGVLPNGQFPPQLQQAFAQFQFVNQQLAAQLAAIGTNPGVQATNPQQAQAQALLSPNFVHPAFHNILAQQQLQQQQHARAAGGQTAMGSVPQSTIQANQPGAPNMPQGNAQGSVPVRSSTPGNTSTVIRENYRPNGERWQMVIQSGQVNINPNHSLHNHAPPLSATPMRASPAPQSIDPAQTTVPSIGLMHLQSNLSAMEVAMAGGNPLPEAVIEQARQMLSGIPDLPQEVHSNLNTRLNNAAHRAHHLRETLNSDLTRVAQERVTTQRTTFGAQSSAVYVLSSPIGPQALLISPNRSYSTPWQLSTSGSIPQAFVHHHSPGAPALSQNINFNNPRNGQGPHVDPAQVIPAQQAPAMQVDAAHAAQAQQQQQQANQARDIIRILLPLGGHLWLLVRLFGFVYFFTAGAGWRRTILLGVVACLVFVAQTGIFRPVVQAIWDPVRRHAEGLVPLAGNEHPRAAPAGAGDNVNAPNAQPVNPEPMPQEAAQRLLQEREGRDMGLLRQSMRQVERAIALFVASLVPGVGERHIAAREASEAARQAEIREREDQVRREEEERQRVDGNVAGLAESSTSAAGEAGQPPLIEV